jgi:hypothetical protein
MVSIMRLFRELNSVSIDEVAAAIGCRKSTLSVAERFAVAGPKLRLKLAKHYQLPWEQLVHQIDGAQLASAIVAQLCKQQKVKTHGSKAH